MQFDPEQHEQLSISCEKESNNRLLAPKNELTLHNFAEIIIKQKHQPLFETHAFSKYLNTREKRCEKMRITFTSEDRSRRPKQDRSHVLREIEQGK
jgi:hypothetical protein